MNDPKLVYHLTHDALGFAYEACREDGINVGNINQIFMSLVLGKYTELLIQECATIINGLEGHEGPGDCDKASYVKEMFGVN